MRSGMPTQHVFVNLDDLSDLNVEHTRTALRRAPT